MTHSLINWCVVSISKDTAQHHSSITVEWFLDRILASISLEKRL